MATNNTQKKCTKVYDNVKISNKVQSMCSMHGCLDFKNSKRTAHHIFFYMLELEHESCRGRLCLKML